MQQAQLQGAAMARGGGGDLGRGGQVACRRAGVARVQLPAHARDGHVVDVVRQVAQPLDTPPQLGLVRTGQFFPRRQRMALKKQEAGAFHLGIRHDACEPALVAEVFEFGQCLQGLVDIAAMERDAREGGVADDHVISQAHVACQRQVGLQQLGGLV